MHCRYLVRKSHYEEMARTDALRAMQYLRHHVAQVIDHSNPEQLHNVSIMFFRYFLNHLFKKKKLTQRDYIYTQTFLD